MQTVETEEPTPTTRRTSADWAQVIEGLNQSVKTYDNEIATLTHDRDNLALDAAMGDAGASKRQQQIQQAITTKQNAANSTRVAVDQAIIRLEIAKLAEFETVESERVNKMETLAAAVMESAINFDAHLQQVVAHADVLKQTIKAMLQIAKNPERIRLDQLLRFEPFIKAGEAAGLRAHLYLPPYSGPQSHVLPLADQLASHLEQWMSPPVVVEEQPDEPEPLDKEPPQDAGDPAVVEPKPWMEQLKKKVNFKKEK